MFLLATKVIPADYTLSLCFVGMFLILNIINISDIHTLKKGEDEMNNADMKKAQINQDLDIIEAKQENDQWMACCSNCGNKFKCADPPMIISGGDVFEDFCYRCMTFFEIKYVSQIREKQRQYQKIKTQIVSMLISLIEEMTHNTVCDLLFHYKNARHLHTAGDSFSETGIEYFVGYGFYIYEEEMYYRFEFGDQVYYERREISSFTDYKKALLKEVRYFEKQNNMSALFELLEEVTNTLTRMKDYPLNEQKKLECYRRRLKDE